MRLFFFKQKTAYELRISDWSSDVCSSDREQHDRKAEHEPARDARMDEAGVKAAFARWRMFGDIDCRPAIFAAECPPLRDAKQADDHRRGKTEPRRAGDEHRPRRRAAPQAGHGTSRERGWTGGEMRGV